MKISKWLLPAMLVAIGIGTTACGGQVQGPKDKAQSSQQSVTKKSSSKLLSESSSSEAESSKASSSSQSQTTRQPTVTEQLALVLLASGSSSYTTSGSDLLAQDAHETATSSPQEVDDKPGSVSVYALSIQQDDKIPFIMIDGDQAYLFSTQSPEPYDGIRANALHVDLASAWQKLASSADLASVASRLTVKQASSDASSQADDTIIQALERVSGTATEDPSTVSGQGKQTSDFYRPGSQSESPWFWTTAYVDGSDGGYNVMLDKITNQGGDGTGGQILVAHGYEDTTDTDFNLTIDIINGHTYTLKSSELNYYGKFNH
ncbi:hypothetical protein [Lacticaseibacillus sp. GG6-2]